MISRGGLVSLEGSQLSAYIELRSAVDDRLSATFQVGMVLDIGSQGFFGLTPMEPVRVPEHGQIRGLGDDEPRVTVSRSEADQLGLVPIFRGRAPQVHVDEHGRCTPAGIMACLSAGIPHLVWALRGEDRSREGMGGAALEYRFVFRRPVMAGALLEVRSGLVAVGSKTWTFGHWVLDSATGSGVASAEAVAVSLDLETRRAVAIDDATRAALEAKITPGLSL